MLSILPKPMEAIIEGDIDREYNLSILDGDKDLGILGNWKEFVRFLY